MGLVLGKIVWPGDDAEQKVTLIASRIDSVTLVHRDRPCPHASERHATSCRGEARPVAEKADVSEETWFSLGVTRISPAVSDGGCRQRTAERCVSP